MRINFNDIILTALVGSDELQKSDAVILLEGDGYARVPETVRLFKAGLAKYLVISGGTVAIPGFTIPASLLAKKVYAAGVPKNKVIIEEHSQNTREQGVEMMKLAKRHKWKKIILVASPFHQPRAYLTFLKAMKDARLRLVIYNAPARGLPWFKKTSTGLTRLQLLEEEFKKIAFYQKKGHVASVREALAYERRKFEK